MNIMAGYGQSKGNHPNTSNLLFNCKPTYCNPAILDPRNHTFGGWKPKTVQNWQN